MFEGLRKWLVGGMEVRQDATAERLDAVCRGLAKIPTAPEVAQELNALTSTGLALMSNSIMGAVHEAKNAGLNRSVAAELLLTQRIQELVAAANSTVKSAVADIQFPPAPPRCPDLTGALNEVGASVREIASQVEAFVAGFPLFTVTAMRLFAAVDYAATKFDSDPNGERTPEVRRWARRILADRWGADAKDGEIESMLAIRDVAIKETGK